MRMFATKRQIIIWLGQLIEAGLSEPQVWQATAAVEDFVTWWQTTHHSPWDPRRCTEYDWLAYVAAVQSDPARRCMALPWVNAFWRWAQFDAWRRRAW